MVVEAAGAASSSSLVAAAEGAVAVASGGWTSLVVDEPSSTRYSFGIGSSTSLSRASMSPKGSARPSTRRSEDKVHHIVACTRIEMPPLLSQPGQEGDEDPKDSAA